MERKTIQDADALLLYRVGPVYCCSPTLSVESVIMPPRLTHMPGTSRAEPGVFKFPSGIVRTVDLRERFGVDEKSREHPGRVVVVEVEGGHAGFWVDEIIDVIHFPEQGWGIVPAHIPRSVFSRTLLFNNKIQLYADFENLNNFREVGYLRKYIELLKGDPEKVAANKSATDDARPKLVPESSARKSAKENLALSSIDAKKTDNLPNSVLSTGSGHKISTGSQLNNVADDSKISTDRKIIESREKVLQNKIQQSSFNSVKSKPGPDRPVSFNQHSAKDTAMHRDSRQLTATTEASLELNRGTVDYQSSRDKSSNQYPPNKESSYQVDEDVDNSALWVHGSLFIFILIGVFYFINDMVFTEKDLIVDDDSSLVQTPAIVSTIPSGAEKITLAADDVAFDGVLESEQFVEAEVIAEDNYADDYHAIIDENEEGVVIVLNQSYKAMEKSLTITQEGIAQARVGDIKESQQIESADGQPLEHDYTGSLIDESKDESLAVEIEPEVPVINEIKQPDFIIHVVVKGDTLWHIARRYIHNPFRYPELARLSKIKNPDLIYPGDKVKIIFNSK
ncbi:MAG: chemotaxis protein CheW [Gammaproteobacteria bacterium]|nr:chemotaxis protein CheW [Gammaproteobacteria bacterium]